MHWRIVPLMVVFVGLAHFNRVSISVVGTDVLINNKVIGEKPMGWVYSSYLILYTLFMMPGGWFIDRFGPRRGWMVVAFGSAGFVALTGVVGLLLTESVALLAGLMIVRALFGVVCSPLHPTAARLVGNWVPQQGANLANGLVTFGACVGMASTYVAFGWLMDRVGWPAAFLVCGAFTLAVGVVWSLASADHPPGTVPKQQPASAPSLRAQFHELLSNRSLLFLTLGYAALGYFQYLFFYWAQYYFENVYHVSKEDSRVYSSFITLAMGAGMVLGGWLSDRIQSVIGLRRGLAVAPMLGFFLAAFAVLFALRAETTREVVLYLAAAMFMGGMVEGSSWTAAVLIGRSSGGKAAAIMNTGGNAGGLMAPVLTPVISETFGWSVVLQVASGVCVLGALTWMAVTPAAPESISPPSRPDQ
jgi:MFS family permease